MNTDLLDEHTAGTAGIGEGQYADDNGQRDDGEATDPDGAQQRAQNQGRGNGNVPDGFYWDVTAGGKPILKPTRHAVASLLDLARSTYEDTGERAAQLKRDSALFRGLAQMLKKIDTSLKIQPVIDLAKRLEDNPEPDDIEKQLSLAMKRLDNVNQYMATNFVRSVCRQAEQDFANSAYWADIHVQNVHRYRENGNEDAAEQSLMLFENSRAQMLLAGQMLDWCDEQGQQVDIERGVNSALSLRGWSLTQPQGNADRAASRENTKQALFGHAVL